MRYIFYTLYRHLLKVKTNDTPAFSAIVIITMFEFLNILTVLQILPTHAGIDIENKNLGMLAYILAALVLLIINYFFLIKNIPSLDNKYQHASESQKLKGNVLLLGYTIVSVALFFGTIH